MKSDPKIEPCATMRKLWDIYFKAETQPARDAAFAVIEAHKRICQCTKVGEKVAA